MSDNPGTWEEGYAAGFRAGVAAAKLARTRALKASASRDSQPCWLYLFRSGTKVKIGIANNPRKRAQTLTSARGSVVEILAGRVFPDRMGARDAERGAHRQFAALRLKGEWFREDPSILAHFAVAA